MSQNNALLIIGGIWLFALSAIFIWFFRRLNRLVENTTEKSLVSAIEKIINREALNKKEIADLREEIVRIKDADLKHIQKVGMVRFNPFEETGGDHSFSIALLDGKDTGVVVTGLHTRERTRLYVKSVIRGKSEYELSKEEEKALAKAQKEKNNI